MKKNIKNLFNLNNQNIIITGGAGYLGSEFSSMLSKVGAMPIVLDINSKSINLLKKKFKKKGQKGLFLLVDLNNESKVEATINLIIKKYRKIDCLINLLYLNHKMNQKFLLLIDY